MFFKTISVIAINRKNLVAAKVKAYNRKIAKAYEYEYDFENLSKYILKAKTDIGASRVRILVSDDLTYTLKLKIPAKLSGDEEREFVRKKIMEEIPENLDELEWDYKEVETTDKEADGKKEVIVFCVVKKYFDKLKEAIDKANITVEAVEPVSIAQKRYENPVVGLALKKDLEGKDEDVLNLLIKPESDKRLHLPGISKKVTAVLVTIFLFVLIAGFFLYQKGNPFSEKALDEVDTQQEEVVDSNKDTPAQTYSINLINGSTDENVFLLKKNLEEKGFSEFDIDNSEELDYETSVVKVKSSVASETVDAIKEALTEYQTIYPASFLGEESEYDIEIIVGGS